MDYAAFIRATVQTPYAGLAQQQYPRAYRGSPGSHQAFPSFAVDNQSFMTLAQLHQHRQQSRSMIRHGDTSPPKQSDPKPRLAKDEVELLEGEFTKNPKPNSSIKRDIAERMGLEVSRINNWFQNRRAKAKQLRKTLEFEELQARERASGNSTSPEDQDQHNSNGPFGIGITRESVTLSAAAFPPETDAHDDAGSEPNQTDADHESLHAEDISTVNHDHYGTDSRVFTHVGYASPASVFSGHSNPELSIPVQSDDFVSSAPPTAFAMTIPCSTVESIEIPPHHSHPDLSNSPEGVNHFGSFEGFEHPNVSAFVMPSGSTFPSQLLPTTNGQDLATEEVSSETQLQQDGVKNEHFSPTSLSQSPPPPPSTDLRFMSPPPPADIAARRNMRRPAPLPLSSLRSPSLSFGPKTGVEPSRRMDMPSPMRRIASATGSFPGRIQKPMSASAPRSPFNKEALIQSLQGARSPTLGSNGTQGMREATVSSSASDDDQMYTLNSVHVPFRDQSIKTPPLTPGFPTGQFEGSFPYGFSGPMSFPHDESCMTPGLISNGSDFDLSVAGPAPGYACASQPVTPSFPGHNSVGPTFWATLNGAAAGANNVEYNFPDSFQELTGRVSPGTQKSKRFHFMENVTPQDFHIEK